MHIIFLVLYIMTIIGIGIMSRKKVKGIDGFFLGNRNVPPWMSAFSYGTAYFSAVIFIGYAGKIGWSSGISTLWIVVGNTVVGSFLAWQILGRKTREMTQRLNVSTMPQFIEVRYQSKALKIVTAAIVFIFLVPYSASVYKGLSYLFEELFGMSTVTAFLIMSILTAIYLFLGGFVAATIADFIQGIIMIIGVILMLFFIINNPTVGGVANAFEKLRSIDSNLMNPINPPGGIGTILSLVILTSLGSWGLPQMVHKFYTIKDEKSIVSAKWVSTGFALLVAFGAYFTGVLSRLFFPNVMPMVDGVANPDMIIPQVFANTLPNFVSAIILILILSASMSTLASLVLASSSAVALDLIEGALFPKINKNKLMIIMKFLCVLFVVLSFIIAITPNHVLSLAALSWGVVSGCLLAPYLLGLYWEKVTKTGVWAGIITAIVLVVGGALITNMDPSLTPLLSCLGIIVPLVIVPVVSLVTKKYEESHLNLIFNKNKINLLKKERMATDDLV